MEKKGVLQGLEAMTLQASAITVENEKLVTCKLTLEKAHKLISENKRGASIAYKYIKAMREKGTPVSLGEVDPNHLVDWCCTEGYLG